MHSGISKKFTSLHFPSGGILSKSYDKGNIKEHITLTELPTSMPKIGQGNAEFKDVRIFDYIEDDEGKKKKLS